MTENEDISSEVPIYRHIEKEHRDFRPVSGNSEIELISEHIEKHLGNIDSVFHEILYQTK
jgi:hypothetical protein